MALSASESTLLTQTCENMNIAANTCREVLEMLRNLGNTGVVDIADHNNAQGRHANDSSLVHANNNIILFGYTSNDYSINTTLQYKAYAVVAWEHQNFIVRNARTKGASNEYFNNSYDCFNYYLTDSDGTRLAFADAPAGVGKMEVWNTRAQLIDADGKSILAGIWFNVGRTGVGDADGISCQSEIRFVVASGDYNHYGVCSQINSFGLVPQSANSFSIGSSIRAIKDVYVQNSPTVTSDRRAKKNIASIGSQAIDFIKALRPVSFVFKHGEEPLDLFDENNNPVPNEVPYYEGVRTHWGFIAQEVKEALSTAGYEDAALWCLADKKDPDSQQSLRYEELIAPLIKVVQQQQERIEALERKVA